MNPMWPLGLASLKSDPQRQGGVLDWATLTPPHQRRLSLKTSLLFLSRTTPHVPLVVSYTLARFLSRLLSLTHVGSPWLGTVMNESGASHRKRLSPQRRLCSGSNLLPRVPQVLSYTLAPFLSRLLTLTHAVWPLIVKFTHRRTRWSFSNETKTRVLSFDQPFQRTIIRLLFLFVSFPFLWTWSFR